MVRATKVIGGVVEEASVMEQSSTGERIFDQDNEIRSRSKEIRVRLHFNT